MSFASDTKNELAHVQPEKKCCMLAEISGFLRVAGSIGLAGFGKFKIIVTTQNPAVARHYKKLLQDYFGIETKLEIGEGKTIGKAQAGQKYAYSLTIDADNRSEQILRETGICWCARATTISRTASTAASSAANAAKKPICAVFSWGSVR